MTSVYKVIKDMSGSEAARKSPLAVAGRVLYWQLWRRLFRRPMGFTTVTGTTLLLLPKASDSLAGFWYNQVPDFEEMMFALHLLRDGDLFVDVGANQGGWSLTVAGVSARVIAFEPVPLTRERFLQNVRLNTPGPGARIGVQPFGLSDSERTVSFTDGLDAGNHELGEGNAIAGLQTVTVEVKRADSLLKAEHPTLMKIDVEGGELGVLRGSLETLQKPSLTAIIMETFRPHNFRSEKLIASESLLRAHGFLPMAYDPYARRLSELLSPADGGQNTIYVRNRSEVENRLKRGQKVKFCGSTI